MDGLTDWEMTQTSGGQWRVRVWRYPSMYLFDLGMDDESIASDHLAFEEWFDDEQEATTELDEWLAG